MTRRMFGALLSSAAPLAAQGSTTGLPRPAGEIDVTLPNGQVLRPSNFKGKVLALPFILTT